jgi:hypothetical protein
MMLCSNMRMQSQTAMAACCRFVGIVALLALGASDFGCEAFTSSVIVVPHGERLRFGGERLRFGCSGPKQYNVARVLSPRYRFALNDLFREQE